eukprot:CAMPEP_0119304518 /NCGR_PEP_ID=MMETSP1333-20130426/5726_1 /TAXON_ID=418940 /ORGANISM="Scyphosphaera apsteinii, Strain RCC1455" /LENGTH=181 /DNA_ID=CAMNT_0007307417 /DNA_START=125 /DNA_END=670 /DNA_ORIENTATION=+
MAMRSVAATVKMTFNTWVFESWLPSVFSALWCLTLVLMWAMWSDKQGGVEPPGHRDLHAWGRISLPVVNLYHQGVARSLLLCLCADWGSWCGAEEAGYDSCGFWILYLPNVTSLFLVGGGMLVWNTQAGKCSVGWSRHLAVFEGSAILVAQAGLTGVEPELKLAKQSENPRFIKLMFFTGI